MTKLTRQNFLKKTSAGAVAIGALGVAPGAALAAVRPPAAAHAAPVAEGEPFVVYVRNPSAGEMALMIGTREITHVDPDLVARLHGVLKGRRGASVSAKHASVR